MKIISVHVHSFGKLHNLQLNFADGINVLNQNNGFGKTTLASFIRAMLYGFTYTRIKRDGEFVTDVSHWITWNSTEKIGGNMVVEHDGETYKIQRFFGATSKQEELSVINVKTQKPLNVNGNVGEYFLGLTAESYDRSAYYPQESVEISSNENLNTRLAGLVQNTQDDFNKVQEKLRQYKKSLQYERGNGGEIFRLEEEVRQYERQIEERKRAKIQQNQIDARLEAIAQEQNSIKQQVAQANDQLAQLQKKLAQSSPTETEQAQRQRIAELQLKLQRMGNFEADKAQCDQLATEIANTPDAATVQRPVSKPMRLFGIALLISGALMALMGALALVLDLLHPVSAIVALVLGVLTLISGGVLLLLSKRAKPAIQTLQAGPKDQLITDYFHIAGKYFYCEKMSYEEVQQTLGKLYVEYVGDTRELNSLLATLKPANPQQDDLQQKIQLQQNLIAQLQARIVSLSTESGRLDEARKNLQTDFVELEEKVEELKEQIVSAKHRYNVATKVSDLLTQANENLATSYLPDLCNRCAELLSAVTGEAYQLEMDQNFRLKVVVNGASRNLSDFSRGIREITLLCFRLAISHLLFGGNVPFLIIDDAFVNFDEPNFLRATALLKQLKGTQIIYFTCHNRLGNFAKQTQN